MVITIIGILIALLLPAVQAAREAARQVQCKNHLKQIGLALHNYAMAVGAFPPGIIMDNIYNRDYIAEATNGRHGTSWMLHILPYLEQQALYDRWDFTTNVRGNAAVAQTDIAAFYCPSRRSGVRSEDVPLGSLVFSNWTAGGNDYGGCIGYGNCFADGPRTHAFFSWDWIVHGGGYFTDIGRETVGIFSPFGSVAFRDISDGTSHTIMTGEVQRLYHETLTHRFSHDGWALGGAATLLCNINGVINCEHFEVPGSDHPGGAHFGMADGSVCFISNYIDGSTLWHMSSYGGGEIVDVHEGVTW